ncbi:hypothetical protein AB0N62_37230 [Streptomyces sp. NPDC093982]|uniref:hypothetical protein n=1 Tax=Streptomyces sp. NPDC093982 TaxID=3155077 RepID=UPI0034260178
MAVRGRPYNVPRGETPQANEFARFLRELVRGRTLRQLAEEFPYGRQAWSEFLAGTKLPSWSLVEQVLAAQVPEPLRRERHTVRARQLWQAAQQAAAGRAPARAVGGGVEQQRERLNQALQDQLQAERALHRSQQLVHMLLTMLGYLQGRCETLTAERDAARNQARAEVLTALGAELEQAREQLARTQGELERATRERADAEKITVSAQHLAEQHRRELERLRHPADTQPWQSASDGEILPAMGSQPSSAEYERLLERVSTALDEQERDLSRLRNQVGLSSVEAAQRRIVRGEVVDNTDNPTSAPDSSPAKSPDLLPTEPTTHQPSGRSGAWARYRHRLAHIGRWTILGPSVVLLLLVRYSVPAAFAAGIPALFGTLGSAFTYSRRAEPGPVIWQLVGFGVLFMGCALVGSLPLFLGSVVSMGDEPPSVVLYPIVGLWCLAPVTLVVGLIEPDWLGPIGEAGRVWADNGF